MTQRRKGIMVFSNIDRLLAYGIEKGLLEASDVFYARNRLLYTLAQSLSTKRQQARLPELSSLTSLRPLLKKAVGTVSAARPRLTEISSTLSSWTASLPARLRS